MSRLALSQDQIDDINSFLDNELASCQDENSLMLGSIYTGKSQRLSHTENKNIFKQNQYTSDDEDEPLSTENVLHLQDKIDQLERRMFGLTPGEREKKGL